MTAVAFALVAAAGGVARHLVNRLGWAWRGTLAVNVAGSFLLGLLLGAGPSADVALVVGTGGLGAFTTFSAFAVDTLDAPRSTRSLVIATSVLAGVGAAVAGWSLSVMAT